MNIDIRQQTFEKIFKEHLKIETYSKSINSLFSPRLRNKIDYKPYYQRNYVWDYNKATYFIESILLGTEIPPLIFFNNNSAIEIIDGRQRFETILRFMNNEFPLKSKGLNVLKKLKNFQYDELAKHDKKIIDNFLDAKLRIIEFQLVNKPPLDKILEDRVKKEIFSRYNSGITPLKRAEIDNAIYDKDLLSGKFKLYLEKHLTFRKEFFATFFKAKDELLENPPVETLMSFVRKNLVLPTLPIAYYSQGTGIPELLTKLYEKFSDDSVDAENQVVKDFFDKIKFIIKIKDYSDSKELLSNRLAFECFLWALGILDLEEINYKTVDNLVEEIGDYISSNITSYTEIDYGFSKEVLTRYSTTANFLNKKFNIDVSIYISLYDEKRAELKELRKPIDTESKLSELEHLRLNKPEPVRNSIDDVLNMMTKRRFLVRPSYQRKEAINPSKASAIIESVLLGITLPALFIFKRQDGISEVIDGQQRILTLLGYIGAEYIDEKDNTVVSKNHKFYLRKLRILKDLDGKRFDQLEDTLKDKIYDFQLYIVEIDEKQNQQFNPIDLFIRLNDKPYPIREHSFEMWNSWVDIEIIQSIKELTQRSKSWFFVRQLDSATDRDRMENEELVTALSFLEFVKYSTEKRKNLDIYQKTERINARLANKAYISSLFQNITEDNENSKKQFSEALKNVKTFIKKLKYVILDQNKTKEELPDYLKTELNEVFKAGKNPKYFRRTMQDFYILWFLLHDINFEMVKHHRLAIKKEIADIFKYSKNIPDEHHLNSLGYKTFIEKCQNFKNKYTQDSRKIVLSEQQKLDLISQQLNLSSITGAPIFLGDDIEVDHDFPLSKGGKDQFENLKIVHLDENREKGSKV